MPNLVLDREVASKAAAALCEKLVPLGLPFVVVIGLPNEGGESQTVRASCGMKNEANRQFMRDRLDEYLQKWDSGELGPNRKFEPS